MKIITITLNPAFDVHYKIDNLELNKENYVSSVIKNAGGKGINISRALINYGVENTALMVLGTVGGDEFLKHLSDDNVLASPIFLEGRIRENITLHTNSGETRISSEGFSADKSILNKLYKMIEGEKTPDMIVTFTGRLPVGIENNDAIEFLLNIKGLGARLIVDCNSFTIEELIKIKPYLIKPNEQEISQLLGRKVETCEDALIYAKKLYEEGIKNVIISLGSHGFCYWGSDGGFSIQVPEILSISTIGAGDSLIAGFIAGMKIHNDIKDALKLAASFGTAACLTEGTNPPDKDVIGDIKDKIIIKEIL